MSVLSSSLALAFAALLPITLAAENTERVQPQSLPRPIVDRSDYTFTPKKWSRDSRDEKEALRVLINELLADSSGQSEDVRAGA